MSSERTAPNKDRRCSETNQSTHARRLERLKRDGWNALLRWC